MQFSKDHLYQFLSGHLQAKISNIDTVGHGEWSQTFFFTANEQRMIIRFSSVDEDFKALHEVDGSQTQGYGGFGDDGNATVQSWREYLYESSPNFHASILTSSVHQKHLELQPVVECTVALLIIFRIFV